MFIHLCNWHDPLDIILAHFNPRAQLVVIQHGLVEGVGHDVTAAVAAAAVALDRPDAPLVGDLEGDLPLGPGLEFAVVHREQPVEELKRAGKRVRLCLKRNNFFDQLMKRFLSTLPQNTVIILIQYL